MPIFIRSSPRGSSKPASKPPILPTFAETSQVHFSRLTFTQFRNYSAQEISLCAGVNVFTGNNGAGKTNILEAVHFLATTRGFHSQGDKFSLQEGSPWFTVEGLLTMEGGEARVQCSYLPPKGKKIILNGVPVAKMSEHLGKIPLVAVLPSDTQLITDGPAVRRRFMDTFISQYDPVCLQALIQYEKALSQRNALLTQMGSAGTWDRELLWLWERQMIQSGQVIFDARKKFSREFGKEFEGWFHLLVSGSEQPQFSHESQFSANTNEEWEQLFSRNLERDRYSQRTSVGIHKDDLVFWVNGQPVKDFGSQGQQKTYVLALRLAQYALLEQKKGTPPVLLLDDIFDKLDIHRLKAIAGLLEEKVRGQVFVTDTSAERSAQVFGRMNREAKFYQVEKGGVKEDGKEE